MRVEEIRRGRAQVDEMVLMAVKPVVCKVTGV